MENDKQQGEKEGGVGKEEEKVKQEAEGSHCCEEGHGKGSVVVQPMPQE